MIHPAFEGGRLRDPFPAMLGAARSAVERLEAAAVRGPVEIEAETSHAAADVIFRALFSMPIASATAAEVFAAFRAHQRSQPLLNAMAFVRLPPGFCGSTAARPCARRAGSVG